MFEEGGLPRCGLWCTDAGCGRHVALQGPREVREAGDGLGSYGCGRSGWSRATLYRSESPKTQSMSRETSYLMIDVFLASKNTKYREHEMSTSSALKSSLMTALPLKLALVAGDRSIRSFANHDLRSINIWGAESIYMLISDPNTIANVRCRSSYWYSHASSHSSDCPLLFLNPQ
jgi:hypothetical protein